MRFEPGGLPSSAGGGVAEGRGGVGQGIPDHTTPSARAEVASQLFLDRASTPPAAQEGSRAAFNAFKLVNTFRSLTPIWTSVPSPVARLSAIDDKVWG